jgi:hypothetical protein
MNLEAIRRQIARVEKRMAANGAGQQFNIPRGSGMAGLRAAVAAVREAREGRGRDEGEPK